MKGKRRHADAAIKLRRILRPDGEAGKFLIPQAHLFFAFLHTYRYITKCLARIRAVLDLTMLFIDFSAARYDQRGRLLLPAGFSNPRPRLFTNVAPCLWGGALE